MNLRSVIATSLICFCAGGLYGWSALILPMQDAFGVSVAQTGLVFSLAIASFTAAVIAAPRLFGTTQGAVGPTAVGWLGLFGAICVFVATRMQTFESFLMWFSFGFGAASGGIYITALGVASAYDKHQIATPVMVAAFGTGGAVFGPLWRVLGDNGWGLDGLLFLSAGSALTSVIALLVSDKSSIAQNAPSIQHSKEVQGSNRLLATLWLAFATGSFGGLMVLGLASKMMDVAGSGVGLASLALAGIAIGNTIGRLSVAALSTYLPLNRCLILAMLLSLSGLALASIPHAVGGLGLGLALMALGYGIVASTLPLLTRAAFGAAHFPRKFALIFTAWGTAGFVAPWAGGALYERTQSFALPFLCAAIAAVLCGLLALKLGRDGP